MALQKIPNYKIAGLSAAVPKNKESVRNLQIFHTLNDAVRFEESTGIITRHIVGDDAICSSDLCFEAANNVLEKLNWDKSSIECLIFVTQTPDYQLPATACLLQDRLGLPMDCFSIQISLGCSGWVYGLSTLGSIMASANMKRGLLLAGDTVSITKSKIDKATYPLFGDAGTATAVQWVEDGEGFSFHTGSDGSGADAIRIDDGGYRNPVSQHSFDIFTDENGVTRNRLQSTLNGTDVFVFGITKAPFSINVLLDFTQRTESDIDFLILHQANKMMLEKIRKKVKFPAEKVLYSLEKFGNTSSASIPLTIIADKEKIGLKGEKVSCVACGFGVGLSWGSVYFEIEKDSIASITYI